MLEESKQRGKKENEARNYDVICCYTRRALLMPRKTMVREIPFDIVDGIEPSLLGRPGSPYGVPKGPRLAAIGGIGIKRVETSHLIMTERE